MEYIVFFTTLLVTLCPLLINLDALSIYLGHLCLVILWVHIHSKYLTLVIHVVSLKLLFHSFLFFILNVYFFFVFLGSYTRSLLISMSWSIFLWLLALTNLWGEYQQEMVYSGKACGHADRSWFNWVNLQGKAQPIVGSKILSVNSTDLYISREMKVISGK